MEARFKMTKSERMHEQQANDDMEKRPHLLRLETEIDDAVFGQLPIRYKTLMAARPPISQLQRMLTESMTLRKPANRHSESHSKPAIRSTTKPTIILVHGGWQTASTYDYLAVYLHSKAYRVLIPNLPSTIVRPATESGEPDIAAIRNCILQETDIGRDVVLVMHSYGASVGCEVLNSVPLRHDGAKGCVIRLGFVAGWIPKIGDSIWPKERKNRWMPGFVLNEDLITLYDGVDRFFNHLPLDRAEKLASQLPMQSRWALASTLTHNTYRSIPSAYLLTTIDRAMPPKMQAQVAKVAGSVVTLTKMGHIPFADEDGAKEVGRWICKDVCGEMLAKL